LILLADTHLLLWAAGDTRRLSSRARQLLEDGTAERWFSAASIWEIAVKHVRKPGDVIVEPRRLRRGLLENGWRELPVTSEHGLASAELPPIHKDPFDRILVAQAITEGATLVTSDEIVARYPGPIRKV
jgi:PIN domain nuclease of toxin-antitoxin system